MTKKQVILNYKRSCNDIAELFCKKQDLEFDGWVGHEIGGVAIFCTQYFFTIDNMVLDLETKQPKGLIIRWQEESTDYLLNGGKETINYKSYTLGLRVKDLSK